MRQALTEALIDFAGALVVVSHDRHLLRSTTDEFYLVHDGQVAAFDGDLEDYQQWLAELQRPRAQDDDTQAPPAGVNTAQTRKDQKRREAEFRKETQPLRQAIGRYEQQLATLETERAEVEGRLGDSALYESARKSELNDCLQRQGKLKSALEEAELGWLEAQEQLETLSQAFSAE